MSLRDVYPISFIPVHDPEAARAFYETILGLAFESQDSFAVVFRLGPTRDLMLRLVRMPAFTPAPYTIFGWEVPSIDEAMDQLSANGVTFLRFDNFGQDDRGIWTAPGGARIAWFKDPDGNTLSVTQHPLGTAATASDSTA